MKLPVHSRRSARRGVSARAGRAASLRAVGAPIRWSRVATAQARIAADYYERRDVRDRLIEALLDELGRRPA